MNPLDRKLATLLRAVEKSKDATKAGAAAKEFGQIRSRVVDGALGRLLEELFSEFKKPTGQRSQPEPNHAASVLIELERREFVFTPAFLASAWSESFSKLSLLEFVCCAPDAKSIDAWAKITKTSPQTLQTQLSSDVTATYSTAGADWLLARAKPQKLTALLDLFLTRQTRPKFLPTWSDALATALAKDKRGALLKSLLHGEWAGEDRLIALVEVLRYDRGALAAATEQLPEIAATQDAKPTIIELVRQLATAALLSDGLERERLTTTLVRIGTGIVLAVRRTGHSNAMLEEILRIGRRFETTTKGEQRKLTWALQNLGTDSEAPSGGLHVTEAGARRIAVAFEKAAEGFSANDILHMLARNLGMQVVGVDGDRVTFDPLQHEDTEGDMQPGDPAIVLEPGWRCSDTLIIRPKVKPKE